MTEQPERKKGLSANRKGATPADSNTGVGSGRVSALQLTIFSDVDGVAPDERPTPISQRLVPLWPRR